MALSVYVLVIALSFILSSRQFHGAAQTTDVCLTVPSSVNTCYTASLNQPISPKAAKVDCLQRLLWNYEPEANLTRQDLQYFSSLSKSNLMNGQPQPKTGFRVRKEYHTLTDIEHKRLHAAFQRLYNKGLIEKYALLHKSIAKIHYDGVSYLPWKRVFLAMFEEELRIEDNTLSLPYLDLTTLNYMDNGVNSFLWTNNLLGNGFGDIVTGPFANWKTVGGKLWREYGSHQRGTLITEENIEQILTKCHMEEISFPTKIPGNEEQLLSIIEFHQNAAQNWIGGDMADRNMAAFDPTFYMVSAFFDLLWEETRSRQKTVCGMNPEVDYPTQTGGVGHGANDPMTGFDGFTNLEGLKNYWTANWYTYAKRPQCGNCGSKYLYCDHRNKCVSHSRRTDYNVGKEYQSSSLGISGSTPQPFEPPVNYVPKRTVIPFLPSLLSDGRNRASAKRDAKTAVASKLSTASAYGMKQPGPKKAAPQPPVNISQAADTFLLNNAAYNPLSGQTSTKVDLKQRLDQFNKNVQTLGYNSPTTSSAANKARQPPRFRKYLRFQ